MKRSRRFIEYLKRVIGREEDEPREPLDLNPEDLERARIESAKRHWERWRGFEERRPPGP